MNPLSEQVREIFAGNNDSRFSWSLADIESELQLAQSKVFLWKLSSDNRGFILYRCEPTLVNIMFLCVQKKGRREGYQMMADFLNRLFVERLEVHRVLLEVHLKNDRAMKLYQRIGFVKQRIRQGYYKDGGDAWLGELYLE